MWGQSLRVAFRRNYHVAAVERVGKGRRGGGKGREGEEGGGGGRWRGGGGGGEGEGWGGRGGGETNDVHFSFSHFLFFWHFNRLLTMTCYSPTLLVVAVLFPLRQS